MSSEKLNKLQLHINSRINRGMMNRNTEAIFGNIDTKNDRFWDECGYPEVITPEMFRAMYERNAIATAGVDRTIDKCWQEFPVILESGVDDEATSPWERSLKNIFERAWTYIKEADKRNAINQYSCLIIQIKDGKKWNEPVDTAKLRLTKDKAIVRYIPAWQEQIRPSQWQNDETADDYGQPTMWEYQESRVQSANGNDGKPERSIQIHPSRIIVLAEGALDGSIYSGVPLNRAGFNNLIDLTKIRGSAAEGFKKNASRQLHTNYNKDSVSVSGLAQQMGVKQEELLDLMDENIAALNAGIDAAMFTMGADVQVLSVAAADPEPAWQVAANEYCASIKKPFTIIVGQQTGRLASDEDKFDHAMTAQQRRVTWCDSVIKQMVEWYINHGVIDAAPANGYYVKWSDLLSPSELDKAELMSKLASANQAFASSGAGLLLTADEIRGKVGLEPLSDADFPDGYGENDETITD